ncbi:NAD(P)/FAD-dependent oxidoreductase [Pelomonas sp. KK5]|uniref:flavin-containing monooxygenase n=1 Tax=Pelomonas sp. KK5 TaxID=1855730 RepID=UPI00097CADC9|nr:NAD(P)/FAD-dependent oxidoreductase [Pelomonas sp. KK5]
MKERKLRIAVIGAGMAGILAAIRLKEAGKHEVVVYEKAARIGGTWRENSYPGLNCDVPAHAYTYSFAPHAEWSSFLAPGPEIQQYFEGVVDRHGVRPLIRFNSEITRCEWTDGRWQLETADGQRDTVDVLIAATGVLHHINLPQIPGLDSFAGHAFHTARWDHSVQLDGQRVGIIGNGSTGVQIVSALAGRAARVSHIQRTPQWIMPMPNEPYTEAQKAAFRADPKLIDEIRYGEPYMGLVRRFTDAVADPTSPAMAEIEAYVLGNLEQSIADPALKEKLRPDYRAACKRLIYSPDYYQKVQRDDVEVVVGGIERIEPAGVRMRDGSLVELDVLALATGFKADRFIRPAVVSGRDGADLDAFWGGTPSAYLGISMPDFPNLFMLNGPTGPVGNFSLIDIAERQWGYVDQLLAQLEQGACREISVSRATMADYDQRRIAAAKTTVFGSGCRSWYLDATGVPTSWPWNYDAFAEATATARLDEYELR